MFSKCNLDEDLRKKVLKGNFLGEHQLIFKLRKLSKENLAKLLLQRDLKSEARAFYKEGINGKSFIIIFTHTQGIQLLKTGFNLTEKQIENLKKFYFFISLFRYFFCKDFNAEDEIPCFDQQIY